MEGQYEILPQAGGMLRPIWDYGKAFAQWAIKIQAGKH